MLFTEFDMEDALEVRYEEGRNEGTRAFTLDYLGDGQMEKQTLAQPEQGSSLSQGEAQRYFGFHNIGENHHSNQCSPGLAQDKNMKKYVRGY